MDKFTALNSVYSVRQFLGFTGYLKHFVGGYARITKPLTKLTKKDVRWRWTETGESALRHLQEILVTHPVLALFNPSARTEVHTDANALGLAGIFFQYQACIRRQTIKESKYHSYELETLAVIGSLKEFRAPLGNAIHSRD